MKRTTNSTRVVTYVPKRNSIARVIPLNVQCIQEQNPIRKSKDKLFIRQSNENLILSIQSINRLESASNYTLIYLLDGRKVLLSKNMGLLEDSLPKSNFFRCHKSHIINLSQVVSFSKTQVVLKSGSKLPIARQKYKAFVREVENRCISL